MCGRLGVTLALILVVAGCVGPAEPVLETDDVVLRVGQEKVVAEGPILLSFSGVSADSRCPADVTCVWEGNAEVELSLRAGSEPSSALSLNTALEPRSVERLGLRITLLEVLPRPNSSIPIPEALYKVRLAVEPSG